MLETWHYILASIGGAAVVVYLGVSVTRKTRSGYELPVLVLIFLVMICVVVLFEAKNPSAPLSLLIGLLVAGSALFGLVFNAAVAREDAKTQRDARCEDVQRALVSEIKHYFEVLEIEDLDEAWRGMEPRIASGYVPFLPSEQNDMVFRSVLPDLHVLPKKVIDPVVKYYSQLRAIDAVIGDTRLDAFTKGDHADHRTRRAAMYFEYLQMKQRAKTYGADALSSMGAKPGINTPGAAHSGQ